MPTAAALKLSSHYTVRRRGHSECFQIRRNAYNNMEYASADLSMTVFTDQCGTCPRASCDYF
eukprot:6210481-Pleurochrysis_carterae.AAC.5